MQQVCFLLLDVQLLQKQTEKASEVLSYLERSYSTLIKADGTKENGTETAAVPDASVGELKGPTIPKDWPNRRSVRRPPTDITPDDVRGALNLYKAKLSLMARSSKSSKREIKTTYAPRLARPACVANACRLLHESSEVLDL